MCSSLRRSVMWEMTECALPKETRLTYKQQFQSKFHAAESRSRGKLLEFRRERREDPGSGKEGPLEKRRNRSRRGPRVGKKH